MMLTTTNTLDGVAIKEYVGIVTGEAIMGVNVVKDLFAGARNIVGGRSAAYEQELRKGRDIALKELTEEAEKLGANAVIGIDLDYESVGDGNMLMIAASGTAVKCNLG